MMIQGLFPCGYQTCDASYQTCRGNKGDNDSLRCYDCSDFIMDVQKDCDGPIGKECSEYCIGALKQLLTDERQVFKEKEESLQLTKRNLSSLIETLKKDNYTIDRNEEENNILLYQIGTGIFFVLFVIFLVLYIYEKCTRKRKRVADQSDLNVGFKSSSRTESFDSGNISISEQVPLNSGEKDRLQQVKPKEVNGTKKMVPTGGQSVENIYQEEDELGTDVHQSFLKTT